MIYIYIYIHICIYVHMYIYIYVNHVHPHVYVDMCLLYIYLDMYMQVYGCIFICIFTYIYICIYVYICRHVWICKTCLFIAHAFIYVDRYVYSLYMCITHHFLRYTLFSWLHHPHPHTRWFQGLWDEAVLPIENMIWMGILQVIGRRLQVMLKMIFMIFGSGWAHRTVKQPCCPTTSWSENFYLLGQSWTSMSITNRLRPCWAATVYRS